MKRHRCKKCSFLLIPGRVHTLNSCKHCGWPTAKLIKVKGR